MVVAVAAVVVGAVGVGVVVAVVAPFVAVARGLTYLICTIGRFVLFPYLLLAVDLHHKTSPICYTVLNPLS